MTLIFLKNRKLFLLQTEKEIAASSGSTNCEKQQRHNDLIRALPPNLHASPCLQGQEIPEPPLGTGWPSLPLLDSLWDNKAEESGCFLARKTHFRATTSFHRGEIKPSGVQSVSQRVFACIKLEQNTNQHEMQRAEVFLSHVHTHTHTHRVQQGNTHLIGRTLETLS